MFRARRHPLDFRRDEVAYVMQRWKAADSCALVGVGSVGKSNLLQHLANSEVQRTYIPNISNEHEFKAIIIDPNMLGPLPVSGDRVEEMRVWAGYELMMHRLFMAFYPFDMLSEEEARGFYSAYEALQDGTNPIYTYMGLRYFELGLDIFLRKGIRIVFMFDEFEDLLRNMPTRFFLNLRGLRDANKRLLSYLTFTRAPLSTLVDELDLSELEIEPFTELFTDNILYVGPYNEMDARRMVENMMSRNQKAYPEATLRFLMWATGQYAGLLRSGFRLLDAIGPVDSASMMNDELLRELAMRRAIRMECRTLWLSLTSSERKALKAVARLIDYTRSTEMEQAIAMLAQKKLLRIDQVNNTLHIEPPVFRIFVSTDPEG
ncbi:MAG: hypothetical protein OHK0046_27130 [Anaerolineae bacterium]